MPPLGAIGILGGIVLFLDLLLDLLDLLGGHIVLAGFPTLASPGQPGIVWKTLFVLFIGRYSRLIGFFI